MIHLNAILPKNNQKDVEHSEGSATDQIQQIERIQDCVNAHFNALKTKVSNQERACISISIQISESREEPSLRESPRRSSTFPHSTFAAFSEYNDDVQVHFEKPRDWCAIL